MDPNVLRECAQRLLETADFIRNTNRSESQSATTTTSTTASGFPATSQTPSTTAISMMHPRPNSVPSQTDGNARDETVGSEHNRLFGYRPPGPVRGRMPRGSSRRSPYTNSRSMHSRGRGNNTWTRSFVCMAVAGQETPPSTAERIDLSLNGLGEKKLTFPKDGNVAEVHETILSAFPALGEGYEILRATEGRCKELLLIPMPPSGFSVNYLQSVLGQAKGYLRPLQRDIMETSQGVKNASPEKPTPKVQCFQCMKEFEMDKLKDHQKQEHPIATNRKRQATLFDVDHVSYDGKDDQASPPAAKNIQPTTGTVSACTSTERSDELQHLVEMFPDKTTSELETCLRLNGTYSNTVNSLLGQNSSVLFNAFQNDDMNDDDDDYLLNSIYSDMNNQSKEERLSSELKNLQRKMSDDKVKLRIDEEDLLEDAMVYYKCAEFDPTKRLRIVYTGQSAVDTGGVIRQFYTQLLSAVSKQFFQGIKYCTPIYSSDVVAAGVMKLVGVMVVHSILQGGPGFPIFSPAVFNYLCKGDLREAVKTMTIEDCSMHIQDLIKKVAEARDVQELDKSDKEDVAIALSESGSTAVLTNDNKMKVIQTLIVHDAIGKRKIVLDQLREGLQTLGFGDRLSVLPDLFKELFVAGEEITADKVKECLTFPTELSDEESTIKVCLEDYVMKASCESLKDLLIFATGAPCLPDFGLGKITVEFSDDSSIFSSTCLKKITFPRKFPDNDTILAAICGVCDNAGRAFTSI